MILSSAMDMGALSSKMSQSNSFLSFGESTLIACEPLAPVVMIRFGTVRERKKIQVILSDTRFFRYPWKRDSKVKDSSAGNIVLKTEDGTATILGEAQWN